MVRSVSRLAIDVAPARPDGLIHDRGNIRAMTTDDQVSTTSRNALVLVAPVVGCAALYWLKDILTPLAMAMFVMVMIDSFVRVLKRRLPGLPEWANLLLAIVGSLLLFGVSAWDHCRERRRVHQLGRRLCAQAQPADRQCVGLPAHAVGQGRRPRSMISLSRPMSASSSARRPPP